jgi:hypothetical protein
MSTSIDTEAMSFPLFEKDDRGLVGYLWLTIETKVLWHANIFFYFTWFSLQKLSLNTIKVGIKFTPPYGTTHPKGHKIVHRAAYHTGPRDVPLSLWLASIRGAELSVTPLSCPRPQVGLLSPFSLSSTLPFLHSATL